MTTQELLNLLRWVRPQLLGRAVAYDTAVCNDTGVVADTQGLRHIMGYQHAGQAHGAVEIPDQLHQYSHGNRVLAGKGLVVHDQLRVQRDAAGQGHAPGHTT